MTKQPSRKVDINWEEVFGEEKRLQAREIMKRLEEIYNVPPRRTRDMLRTDLQRSLHGWYLNPADVDGEMIEEVQEEQLALEREESVGEAYVVELSVDAIVPISEQYIEQDIEELLMDSQPVRNDPELTDQAGLSDDDYADFVRKKYRTNCHV